MSQNVPLDTFWVSLDTNLSRSVDEAGQLVIGWCGVSWCRTLARPSSVCRRGLYYREVTTRGQSTAQGHWRVAYRRGKVAPAVRVSWGHAHTRRRT